MRCQAWVDPTKFNKKGKPTPRSRIGYYNDALNSALVHVSAETRRRKLEQQWGRAQRCGGRVELSMWPDEDAGGYTGGIEAELFCTQCRASIHHIGMNGDIAADWIQERLDSMP